MELFPSAYKSGHSTELAPIKVQKDILEAIDQDQCVMLLLLDLSTAFDTVDHRILFSRLTERFGTYLVYAVRLCQKCALQSYIELWRSTGLCLRPDTIPALRRSIRGYNEAS